MAKPMRVKISSIRSRTMVSGCRWPSRGRRPGSVTSTPPAGAVFCAASSYAFHRASMATLSALACWPISFFCSTGALPISCIQEATMLFLRPR